MVRVISQETVLEKRRQGTRKETIPFMLGGKVETVEKNVVNGEMETLEIAKPLGEMVSYGSTAELKELLRKVVLDVEMGREQVATLYEPIYDTINDPNLPEILDAKWAMHGNCVFLEHFEGSEVKFGSISAEEGPTARIKTYTTGFEITKKMVDFNETFKFEMLNNEMGVAYNALLNHLHLGPIITYKYKTDNKTAFQGSKEEDRWLGIYKSLKQGLIDSRAAKRPGTVLIANSADELDIAQALRGGQVGGTIYPALSGISDIIYYDGWETMVGNKEYSYEGQKPGVVHLVRPKRGFKELVKRDLTIDRGNADISRLIEEQTVGYSYRGVFAAVEENVQEIAIG